MTREGEEGSHELREHQPLLRARVVVRFEEDEPGRGIDIFREKLMRKWSFEALQ